MIFNDFAFVPFYYFSKFMTKNEFDVSYLILQQTNICF